tara:strand:+ start:126 stop:254 length:129 start_codon:yes stop_codon:yes gene_type:complete
MRFILILTVLATLAGCGTVGGAVNGLGDDFFRLIDFGADKIL